MALKINECQRGARVLTEGCRDSGREHLSGQGYGRAAVIIGNHGDKPNGTYKGSYKDTNCSQQANVALSTVLTSPNYILTKHFLG